MARWSGRDYFFAATLFALLFVTRLPLLAAYLYEWDSVQFALGLEQYDIPLHHPHPPGYPLYMLSARVVNHFIHDANASLSILSVLFSSITLLAIYALGREMAGRGVALVAGIVLFCAPVFWLYGEVSTIYAAEGLWSVLIAFSCYRALKGGEGWLVVSAALLGIAGGFRANIVLFLFPLWLYCALRGRREGRRLLPAFLVLAVSILFWLLPLFILFGRDYFEASRLLYGYINTTSIFADPAGEWVTNAKKAILYSFYGFGPVCWIIILYFLATWRREEQFVLPRPFFLWWVLPSFSYYFLVHIKKPGYILTYTPALALLFGLLFCRCASRRALAARLPALALALAWNLLILFPPEGGGLGMVFASGGRRFSLRRLDDKGGALEAFRLLRERADDRTAVLSVNNGFTRFASYYLPEHFVYHSDYVRFHPLVIYHDRRAVATGEGGVIDLMPGIEKIAVIGPAETVTFTDPGLTTEEICRDPPVTIFIISPAFREVVYDQEYLDKGMREVRIRRGSGQ